MKDFDNLAELWNKQQTPITVDSDAIIAKAKKTQNQYNTKVLTNLLALLMSLAVIVWVLFIIHFKTATTYIGIGLISVAIISFVVLRFWHYIQFKKINLTQNPTHVLQALQKLVTFQKLTQTRLIPVYIITLSLGLALYFIEVTAAFSLTTQIIIYVATAAWIAFAYFMLGKKQARKEEARLQSVIDSIKKIESGLAQN